MTTAVPEKGDGKRATGGRTASNGGCQEEGKKRKAPGSRKLRPCTRQMIKGSVPTYIRNEEDMVENTHGYQEETRSVERGWTVPNRDKQWDARRKKRN